MDPRLHLAASTGDIDGIMKLREKIDEMTSDVYNHTILHLAALSNQSECVSAILKEFPHLLEKPNSRKETALHLSARNGFSDVVGLLIQKWRDLDSAAVDLLVKSRGLDSDDKSWVSAVDFIRKGNVELDTALHLAVRYNHPKVVEVIVKADRNDKHSQNTDFKTPFYLAVIGGNEDMLKIMLQNCRNPAAYYGPEGQTILHLAIERRHTEFATLILREKTYLYDIADDKGWTAFHYAAHHNCGSILNHLLDMDERMTYEMSAGRVPRSRANITKKTALHIAAYQGHVSIVLNLMRFYINYPVYAPEGDNLKYTIAEVDEENRNILHMAADQSHKELVQAILQYCPDLNNLLKKKDKAGDTPLHLLVWRGCFVPELIKHEGVDRNATNRDNLTPLDLLYIHEDIVADQLKIKEALEDSEFINQRWNFGLRKSNPELITAESLVYPSKRHTKDAKFKKARDLLIKEEINLYRARINTQIIVTALITTVTFTVGFTMPGGLRQDEGSAVLSKKTAFNVFVLADTVALLLSMSSLALYFVASMYQDAEEISKLVDASTVLNIVSVVATMLTFVMGIYVVLPHSSALVIAVSVMCGFFLLLIILLMIKVIKDPIEKFKK